MKEQIKENEQKEFLKIREIRKIVINLQRLGAELKEAIYLSPASVMKDYLLFETSKIIELKTAHDFYYLQNKISRMLDLVIQWNLDSKIQELLEEIEIGVKKIVQSVEEESSGF